MTVSETREPPVKIGIVLPAPLARQIKLILLDPAKGRTQYGKLSGLIQRLLKEWLAEQRKAVKQGEELPND